MFAQHDFTLQKLVDVEAIKKNILAAIKQLVSTAKKCDSILIQYSGHGMYVPDKNGERHQ